MYYPKSQIQTNLYTNGGELYYELGEPYTGYYWKTSQEEFFSGKTPQDLPSFKLTKLAPTSVISPNANNYIRTLGESEEFQYSNDDISVFDYPLYKQEQKLLPSYSPNIPSIQDYQIGEYRRYFCKKTNEILYLEINKDTYDKLISKDPTIVFQYYQPFNIPWKIIGNIGQTYIINKDIVELIMKRQKLPMFDKYLKEDYIKYYK